MSFRPLWGLTIAAIPALCLLLGLGTWQVQRLQWKLDLIEQVSARATEEPQSLGSVLAQYEDEAALEYRRVLLRGAFDHSREAHFYGLNNDGKPGYTIVTRFLEEGGVTHLVNRGFVPLDKKEASTRAAGQIDGPVTVTGLLRVPAPKAFFAADNQPADNIWFFYEPEALASYFEMDEAVGVIIEAEESALPGGLPKGGQTRLQFVNNHLGYVVTWYGLAMALIVIYFAFHYSKGRLTFKGGEKPV